MKGRSWSLPCHTRKTVGHNQAIGKQKANEKRQQGEIKMRKYIDITQDPTPEQIAMLKKAATFPVLDDDEYPELSEAELQKFQKAVEAT
jgi:hypothetical protein